MIDSFALAVSHGLILIAAWRLIRRPDIDDDDALPPAPIARFPWFEKAPREDA